ncbi:Response regulator protein TodT [Caulifigura coniformis]|uniref:Response regulator protein TodT n=1 Tax=Caulifigura coniformis TaxID=2527983 RepID=A0A517SJ67_9PLAN|nr:response regulator [Caulifigura coniformis]QDT56159.1 Response regulator protein TodT [Caulifigura coniformis]
MSLPTVFVVDDDRDFRDSLAALLSALGHRVETFDSAAAFREGVDAGRPGCLLLDIRMPVESGLEMYADLVRAGKRLPVIFITGHADVSTAVAAMKTGAVEFLEKPFQREQLASLVDRALAIDAEWRLADNRFRELDESIQRLSPNDLETLQLIFDGATNKAMAARLFISERAVELRRQRLMQRLGVRSVPELLELAITHRILSELRSARHTVQ